MAKRHLGIDASHWQGAGGVPEAWLKRLKGCGVEFALFKATQGTGYVDPSFDSNRKRAEKLGLLVGAYHFLEEGSGQAQADHFLKTVRKTGAVKDIPLVVDVERVPTPTTADDPRAPTVRVFLRRLRSKAPKAARWLYTSPGYWRSIGNPDVNNGLVDSLWQARWDGKRHTCKKPNLPAQPPRAGFAGFGDTPIWQFGMFRVMVDRKMRGIDGNAFYGSDAELVAVFTGQQPPQPQPNPPDYKKGYNAAIQAALKQVKGMKVPAVSGGPAFQDGVREAIEDLSGEIASMKLG